MRSLVALVLLAAAFGAAAQSTYRWVDKEGKVHYSDIPPLPADAKSITPRGARASVSDGATLPYQTRKAAEAFPIILFTTERCGDPCQDGRLYLSRRNLPFTEKSVVSPEDRDALRNLTGEAEAVVPVLKVGSQFSRGFSGSQWEALLDAAGYPNKAKTAKP